MGYEVIGHTADIRLKVWGLTEKELFRDALLGMMNLIKPLGRGMSKSRRVVKIEAGDQTALLVDFLNEALYQSHTKKEIYDEVKFNQLTDKNLEAELIGFPVDEFDEDIKAVTYHEAEIKKRPDGQFETTLIFDI
ncbi:archease [Patescibacteria group bacterium]|nr:archease [Patescibacteria group bacterium]